MSDSEAPSTYRKNTGGTIHPETDNSQLLALLRENSQAERNAKEAPSSVTPSQHIITTASPADPAQNDSAELPAQSDKQQSSQDVEQDSGLGKDSAQTDTAPKNLAADSENSPPSPQDLPISHPQPILAARSISQTIIREDYPENHITGERSINQSVVATPVSRFVPSETDSASSELARLVGSPSRKSFALSTALSEADLGDEADDENESVEVGDSDTPVVPDQVDEQGGVSTDRRDAEREPAGPHALAPPPLPAADTALPHGGGLASLSGPAAPSPDLNNPDHQRFVTPYFSRRLKDNPAGRSSAVSFSLNEDAGRGKGLNIPKDQSWSANQAAKLRAGAAPGPDVNPSREEGEPDSDTPTPRNEETGPDPVDSLELSASDAQPVSHQKEADDGDNDVTGRDLGPPPLEKGSSSLSTPNPPTQPGNQVKDSRSKELNQPTVGSQGPDGKQGSGPMTLSSTGGSVSSSVRGTPVSILKKPKEPSEPQVDRVYVETPTFTQEEENEYRFVSSRVENYDEDVPSQDPTYRGLDQQAVNVMESGADVRPFKQVRYQDDKDRYEDREEILRPSKAAAQPKPLPKQKQYVLKSKRGSADYSQTPQPVKSLALPSGPSYDPTDEEDLIREATYQQQLKSRVENLQRTAEDTVVPRLPLGNESEDFRDSLDIPEDVELDSERLTRYPNDSLDFYVEQHLQQAMQNTNWGNPPRLPPQGSNVPPQRQGYGQGYGDVNRVGGPIARQGFGDTPRRGFSNQQRQVYEDPPRQGYANPQRQGFVAIQRQQNYADSQRQNYADPQRQNQGYADPQRQGYANPLPQGYANPQTQGYANPQPQGYSNAPRQGYANQQRQAYAEPQRRGYANQAPQGYQESPRQAYGNPQRQAFAEPQGRLPDPQMLGYGDFQQEGYDYDPNNPGGYDSYYQDQPTPTESITPRMGGAQYAGGGGELYGNTRNQPQPVKTGQSFGHHLPQNQGGYYAQETEPPQQAVRPHPNQNRQFPQQEDPRLQGQSQGQRFNIEFSIHPQRTAYTNVNAEPQDGYYLTEPEDYSHKPGPIYDQAYEPNDKENWWEYGQDAPRERNPDQDRYEDKSQKTTARDGSVMSRPEYDFIEHNKVDYGRPQKRSYKKLHEVKKEEEQKLNQVFIQPKVKGKGSKGSRNTSPSRYPTIVENPSVDSGDGAEELWAQRSASLAHAKNSKNAGKKRTNSNTSMFSRNNSRAYNTTNNNHTAPNTAQPPPLPPPQQQKQQQQQPPPPPRPLQQPPAGYVQSGAASPLISPSQPMHYRQQIPLQPVTQQLITEDGQRISVDVNLRLISPPVGSEMEAASFQPIGNQRRTGLQYPVESAPATGQPANEVLEDDYPIARYSADDVLSSKNLYGGVAGGPGGYVSDSTHDYTGEGGYTTNPYKKIPPIPTSSEGAPRSAPVQSEGSYMLSYLREKEKEKKVDKPGYRVYGLKDYQRMQKEVRLGTLGPDLENNTYKERREKMLRQNDYARSVKDKNTREIKSRKPPAFPRPEESEDTLNKRKLAIEYARNVPKPTVRPKPNPYNNYEMASKLSPIAKPSKTQPSTPQDPSVEVLDLQKLHERHEQDKRSADLIRQKAQGVSS